MRPAESEAHYAGDPDAPIQPLDGGPRCDYCDSKRFVLGLNGELKPCPKCNMVALWQLDMLRAFSSTSAASQSQTFLNFQIEFNGKEEEILRACLLEAEDFANSPDGRWLVIWGERGSGKSHLCAAVDNHLRQAGIPSLFITAPDLLASLRQAMEMQAEDEPGSYSRRMHIVKTAPVLILDDLSAELSTPWADSVLFEILDYRYRNRLPTMIVTNSHPDNLEPRISSRIQDTSLCRVIENAAPDYRRRPREEKRAS